MAANTVLAQVPIRQGFNTFTYLGTTSAPISTYNAVLSGMVAGDVNGGSPDVYSPLNPSFANDFNTFTQNRSYVVFAKSNFNLGLSGDYVPPQPAKFNLKAGFNTIGFDSNCIRQPLSVFGDKIFTAYLRSIQGTEETYKIYVAALGNNQTLGLNSVEPLSSYVVNATTNMTLTAERVYNLLITNDNRFIVTNPPVSGIRV
jgi:hypothetical protein